MFSGLRVHLMLILFIVILSSETLTHHGKEFNTMTLYFWVNDMNRNVTENEQSLFTHEGSSCKIERLNVLLRHGARYPSLYWIKRMKSFHKRVFRNPVVRIRNPQLENWTSPFPEEKEYSQSKEGDEEMFLLGTNFGTRFSQLMQDSNERVRFAVTNREITYESYKEFIRGLNQTVNGNLTNAKPEIDDKRLHYFTKCKKHNKMTNILDFEYNQFQKSSEMKKLMNKVGLNLGKYVNPEQILTMHQICAFELGIFNKSDWCRFFTEDDLRVVDYMLDIMAYWHRGYGYQLNYHMSCPFTSHLFKTFDEVVNNIKNNNTKQLNVADIQFAHSYTLIPIYSAFGLFKDSGQLLASNMHLNGNRTFKISKICPFSANFAVGLYKCNETDFVVKMFVNEELVNIPACGSKVCSYKKFKAYYSSQTTCDYNEICENISS